MGLGRSKYLRIFDEKPLVFVDLCRLKSGHFNCYFNSACHVLMTTLRYLLDTY